MRSGGPVAVYENCKGLHSAQRKELTLVVSADAFIYKLSQQDQLKE